MPETRATMAAAAENTDLVNKITFFQFVIFTMSYKYTLTIQPYPDEKPFGTTVASNINCSAMQ